MIFTHADDRILNLWRQMFDSLRIHSIVADNLPRASAIASVPWRALERDDFSSNRHPALCFCWSMIPRVEPEGMLFGKPPHTLR
jgi:hypothetical protein